MDETSRLVVQVSNQGINETTTMLQRLSGTAREVEVAFSRFGQSISGNLAYTKQQTSANQSAGESFGSLALKIAGYSTALNLGVQVARSAVNGLKDLAIEAVTLAGSFERSRVAWGVFMKDVGEGSKMFDELYALAQRTPLTFQGVESAAQMLKGFGLQASEIIPTLERMGDVARGNDETMQRLALAYGQALAQGKVLTRDLYQFVNAGVPIFDALATVMGKSVEQVQALVTDGKVGFPELEAALKSLTEEGGQFNGMMEKAAETFEGKLSIAKDNLKGLLGYWGDTFIPGLKSGLDEFNKKADEALAHYNVLKVTTKTGGDAQAAKAFLQEELAQMVPESQSPKYYQYKWALGVAESTILENARMKGSYLGSAAQGGSPGLTADQIETAKQKDKFQEITGVDVSGIAGMWGLAGAKKYIASLTSTYGEQVAAGNGEKKASEIAKEIDTAVYKMIESGIWRAGEGTIKYLLTQAAKYAPKTQGSAGGTEVPLDTLDLIRHSIFGSTVPQAGEGSDRARTAAYAAMGISTDQLNAWPRDILAAIEAAARWQESDNLASLGNRETSNSFARFGWQREGGIPLFESDTWGPENWAWYRHILNMQGAEPAAQWELDQLGVSGDPARADRDRWKWLNASLPAGAWWGVRDSDREGVAVSDSQLARFSWQMYGSDWGELEKRKKGDPEAAITALGRVMNEVYGPISAEYKAGHFMGYSGGRAMEASRQDSDIRIAFVLAYGMTPEQALEEAFGGTGEGGTPGFVANESRDEAANRYLNALGRAAGASTTPSDAFWAWELDGLRGMAPDSAMHWPEGYDGLGPSPETEFAQRHGGRTPEEEERYVNEMYTAARNSVYGATVPLSGEGSWADYTAHLAGLGYSTGSTLKDRIPDGIISTRSRDEAMNAMGLAYNPFAERGYSNWQDEEPYWLMLEHNRRAMEGPATKDFFGAGTWRMNNAGGEVSRPYQEAITDAEKYAAALDDLEEKKARGEISYEGYLQRQKEINEQYDTGTKLVKQFGDAILSTSVNTLANELSSLGEALVSGADGWKSFGDAMGDTLETVIKMIPKLAIQVGLQKLATNIADPVGWALVGGGLVGSVGTGMLGNANGGVYASPSLHQYANGVYDRPQTFAFARGGVFAEAGPEAIMPLSRDSSGRLGVAAQGGAKVSVEVHNYSSTPISSKTQTLTDAAGNKKIIMTIREIARQEVAAAASGGIRKS